MAARYTVTQLQVEILLNWIKSGDIAIPEIQRPFVWKPHQVRDFLDSLYQGYPVGYLIAWRNPTVKLKDGKQSVGKRILIDGQQRVTALMVALLGKEVLTKNYETRRIRIAFHPIQKRFEVFNPAIAKDKAWIDDVGKIFGPDADHIELAENYVEQNPGEDRFKINRVLQSVGKIIYNDVGLIELAEDLDIETVTEIFIRVNSAGEELSQADFAMSKIAANEKYGGNILRKAIDYFCHLAVAPEFFSKIEQNDTAFAASEFWPRMKWLKDTNDDLYDPTYTDMLRVAFTSEFRRGKLQDLVALLSGRNFVTREYEDSIIEDSFAKLKNGIEAFMNKTHFNRLIMILKSAGFVSRSLIGSSNAVNFAYILYLRSRSEGLDANEIERLVRRWYVMSILSGRYSGSFETAFEDDIGQIDRQGVLTYTTAILENELSDSYWAGILPQSMETSSVTSPYFFAYQAAQVYLGYKGFLSTDITVTTLLLNQGDKHHIFPSNYLKKRSLSPRQYNQIANLAMAQKEINISIGDKAPENYFAEIAGQVNGGTRHYGGIVDREQLRENFAQNCIPESMVDGNVPSYDEFLVERRRLMALRMKEWFEALA